MASETLASVILPRPERDLKTALNFSVSASNIEIYTIIYAYCANTAEGGCATKLKIRRAKREF